MGTLCTHHKKEYQPGMGMPPNSMTTMTMAMIIAMMSGTKKRNSASATIAISAMMSKVSVEPSYGSMSTVAKRDVSRTKTAIIAQYHLGVISFTLSEELL
jgi:hypothetical protein